MKHISVVSSRLVREKPIPYGMDTRISKSDDIYGLFKILIEEMDRETVWGVCLNSKNRITCLSQISIGGIDSSSFHPREIFRIAILANASGIIMVHNHPSGDSTPSDTDISATARLAEAATMMGIRLWDHIIIGLDSFYSFRDDDRIK